MCTAIIINGRKGMIVMTTRGLGDNDPIIYTVRWNDNGEIETLAPRQLLFVS